MKSSLPHHFMIVFIILKSSPNIKPFRKMGKTPKKNCLSPLHWFHSPLNWTDLAALPRKYYFRTVWWCKITKMLGIQTPSFFEMSMLMKLNKVKLMNSNAKIGSEAIKWISWCSALKIQLWKMQIFKWSWMLSIAHWSIEQRLATKSHIIFPSNSIGKS